MHRVEVLAKRIVRRQLLQHQVRVPEHDRQQVVEVVRDAAGQPADGFHAFGLPSLRLQGALRELRALLVGHVLGQPQEVRDRAGLVEYRGNHGALPVDRAIPAALLELAAPLLAGQQGRPDLEAESRIGVPRPQHGVGLPPHHARA